MDTTTDTNSDTVYRSWLPLIETVLQFFYYVKVISHTCLELFIYNIQLLQESKCSFPNCPVVNSIVIPPIATTSHTFSQ